jgi:hypothetical protein
VGGTIMILIQGRIRSPSARPCRVLPQGAAFATEKQHFQIDRVFRRVAHREARTTKIRFQTRDDERNAAFEALADSKLISLPDRSLMRRYEPWKIRV